MGTREEDLRQEKTPSTIGVQTDDGLPSAEQFLQPGGVAAPLGVPSGFTAQRTVPFGEQVAFPGGLDPSAANFEFSDDGEAVLIDVAPRFFDGDQLAPSALAPERIAALQQQLVDAGLLAGDYVRGVWGDPRTGRNDVQAYASLLGFANATGMTEQEAVSTLRERTDLELSTASKFQSGPFLRPDPDTLKVGVQDSISKLLGKDRKLNDDELRGLMDTLEGFMRDEHKSAQAAARAEFERQLSQEVGAAGFGTAGGAPGEVQAVNAADSFRVFLEDQYRPEIEFNEERVDFAEQHAGLLRNILTIDQAIGEL